MGAGYFRDPSLNRDRLVFVCEDDLWSVSADGGRAERLTAGVGESRHPVISPDGQLVAYVGSEEGHTEIYSMPSSGGEATRLTFQGTVCRTTSWTTDGTHIVYSSSAGQPFERSRILYSIAAPPVTPRLPMSLPYGVCSELAFVTRDLIILGRNTNDPARWKRYRGGQAGYLSIGPNIDGDFSRLITLDGNMANPCVIGNRVYFLSDHNGIGNVYSCLADGSNLTEHTHHDNFYVRHLTTDGQRLAYQCGAELYILDPTSDTSQQLSIDLPSNRTQRQRRFVSPATYLDSFALNHDGSHLALTTRGKIFTMGDWQGPVTQFGRRDGVRYRLARLLENDNVITIADTDGTEVIEVFTGANPSSRTCLNGESIGRALELEPAPNSLKAAVVNHRGELLIADLVNLSVETVVKNPHGYIADVAWSPDSRYVAYSYKENLSAQCLHIYDCIDNVAHRVTSIVLQDFKPCFDPKGEYLYFLGQRSFSPVRDNMHFGLSFPRGVRAYAIALRNDLFSPFMLQPKPPGDDDKDQQDDQESAPTLKVYIDFDGITERIVPFPLTEGRYYGLAATRDNVLLLYKPISSGLVETSNSDTDDGVLEVFDLTTLKVETPYDGAGSVCVSADGRAFAYRTGDRIRVLPAGEKHDDENDDDKPSRKSGWIDLDRLRVSIDPASEWRQMFHETWRLQQDHFWLANMDGVDWASIRDMYASLIDKVTTRSELSDLVWEMQGELGTSHAYEFGGEYRESPDYAMGYLGCDWVYVPVSDTYALTDIAAGDNSSEETMSPLRSPGLNIVVGDQLLAINGQKVGRHTIPAELLVNAAEQDVSLTLTDAWGKHLRTVRVKTLRSEHLVRYRSWVEHNRAIVHEQSAHRVGYVHVPDMEERGFAEFHRLFLAEYDYPGLIIDVRGNLGGEVSSLLLEKLARKRLGYDLPRYGGLIPYPKESPRGPMVMLTNESAGSDGDIISHSFKMLGLGPLIGTRTWGGVIGIEPSHRLVDHTETTQPEYSFFFNDAGWKIENYGVDPDILVDIEPHDSVRGLDPQLHRGIQETLNLIASHVEPHNPPPYVRSVPVPIIHRAVTINSAASPVSTDK